MARTLTNLVPAMYRALDVVSRELVGMIGAVFRNSTAEMAALNQEIVYPVSSQGSLLDMTPAVTAPDAGDNAAGNGKLSITNSKGYPIRWNGEQQLGAKNAGWYEQFMQNEFTQAMRTITNTVEADLSALYKKFSRGYGTAGTTPFGTANELSDFSQPKKILLDNGAGETDLHLVLGTTAGANLEGKQSGLFKANEAGTDALLREGIITRVQGFGLGKSAQIKAHAKGTGAGYLVNNVAGYAVGATTIAADTGTGTILAGDVVTFEDDTNKYLVTTALSGGSFTIAAPGLRQPLADGKTITVGNAYTANLAFARHAIHLITRAPAMPIINGQPADAADDIAFITDPISGLTFQVRLYRQFGQALIIVCLAWGCDVVNPEHTAVLLG
ncbi:MAG: P22 coat - protein 5 family protein [Deltaproteobacteria bacterium]|nr:P22 coat - protein 5 family protein [Deltaproteobacteria bacterium]